MAGYVNKSGGMLILPDGQKVANGGKADVSKDMAENAGVAIWIESGALVAEKQAKSSKD